MNRVVLAYSGGLDTSVAIHWLGERYNADVVAVCVDVGETRLPSPTIAPAKETIRPGLMCQSRPSIHRSRS